jgi:hypothetical protein
MNSIIKWILIALMFGGAAYFWQKAITLGLSWFEIIVSYIVWPVAVVRGLYFLSRDLYIYFKAK